MGKIAHGGCVLVQKCSFTNSTALEPEHIAKQVFFIGGSVIHEKYCTWGVAVLRRNQREFERIGSSHTMEDTACGHASIRLIEKTNGRTNTSLVGAKNGKVGAVTIGIDLHHVLG